MSTHHYNPGWLEDDDLVAGFVARQGEYAFLRDELARAPRDGNIQHYLLIGQRGAGKTTLLRRLAVAIRHEADLKDHLVALSFPEELYEVGSLGDFWWSACEALGEALERKGEKVQADALFRDIDDVRAGKSGDRQSDAGLQRLLAVCAEIGLRPVMLIDNIDMVFDRIGKSGKRSEALAPPYWSLREALSTTTSPLVIGGSVRLSDSFTNYDKAFYDFFIPKRLGKLPLAEVRQVLDQLAERRGLIEVKARLDERPARLETLYELTGGNPRAIGFIFELIRQGASGQAVDDFVSLMDVSTAYYKHRFEDISEQAQLVMHALAVRPKGMGYGHTAAEIATHTSLPTNTVSAQMDVLERDGLVEKSSGPGRKQYRIAEQLFRLWLQMRGTRRIRQNIIGLAEFLEAMFDREELTAHLHDAKGISGARLWFAVAGTRQVADIRPGLEAEAAARLLEHSGMTDADLAEALPDGDLPEYVAAILKLGKRLKACRNELSASEQEVLLGSLDLTLAEKTAIVDRLCAPETTATEVVAVREILARERDRLLRYGLQDKDLPKLYRLRARGRLPLPYLTVGDADAVLDVEADKVTTAAMLWQLVGAREWVKFPDQTAADAWLTWGKHHAKLATATEWANVSGAMRRSDQFESAGQALKLSMDCEKTSRGWLETANTSHRQRDVSAAETAYRMAIKLDPNDAFPWHGLGVLLARIPERAAEAEQAYGTAIELDPNDAYPWHGIGNLLFSVPERVAEAEAAYRKAIKLDPKDVTLWINLGILLTDLPERAGDTEAAYRKAIELDPKAAAPWNGLGVLFADRPEQIEDAEAAYRKAIELDPKDALVWDNLRILLQQQKRFDEALAAASKAVELNAGYAPNLRALRKELSAHQNTENIRQAVETGSPPAIRQSLTHLLSENDRPSALLTSEAFVEDTLGVALVKGAAQTLLNALWTLGFDRFARPLLLAYTAAVEGLPETLDELEPEVRTAAKRLYERLIAGRDAKAREDAPKD